MRPIPGLVQADQKRLESLLKPIAECATLRLYGSRARGDYRTYSDVDILVEGETIIPFRILAEVETGIEESDLPISVDIVDARRASPAFLRAIAADTIDL